MCSIIGFVMIDAGSFQQDASIQQRMCDAVIYRGLVGGGPMLGQLGWVALGIAVHLSNRT